MDIPNWYELAILALAVFRVFRLIAEDTILNRPRAWLLRMGDDWADGNFGEGYREKWHVFITCPWCCGAWLSLGAWIAWQLWPHTITALATLAALSALVGLVSKNLDKEEGESHVLGSCVCVPIDSVLGGDRGVDLHEAGAEHPGGASV